MVTLWYFEKKLWYYGKIYVTLWKNYDSYTENYKTLIYYGKKLWYYGENYGTMEKNYGTIVKYSLL